MAKALNQLRQTIARIENRAPGARDLGPRDHGAKAERNNSPKSTSRDWIFSPEGAMAELVSPASRALNGSEIAYFPPIHLAQKGVMELSAKGQDDAGALAGFTLALLSSLPSTGDILWCQTQAAAREFGRPYMPGLARFAIAPERILYVRTKRSLDLLWSLEEGLKSGSLAAVVGEGANADFTQSRRLALAAQSGETPCLLLDVFRHGAARAAAMRWQIAAANSGRDASNDRAPGAIQWFLTLTHARSGQIGSHPGTWPDALKVAWNDETHTFHLVPQPAHRAVAEREMGTQTGHTAELLPWRRAS